MNKQSIEAIAELHFHAIPLEINKMTIGMCNEVYELKYATDSVILRMNKEKEWIYGTHKFFPIFQRLQIKIPDLLAADYSKTEFPFCYQIQTKLEGKDLLLVFHELSPAELKAIAKEISIIYDKFNTLPYKESFGGLTGMREEHIDNMLTIMEGKRKRILERNEASKVLNEKVIKILNELITNHKDYFLNVKPKLYYDDMNSKNVMIHNGRFNGLVDLDFLSKGDYLEGIGGIIAAWHGSESGEIYINEIFKFQKLNAFQQKIAKVYAIMHLIGWTCEEGIQFNSNSTGSINWKNVEQKRKKIIELYRSIE